MNEKICKFYEEATIFDYDFNEIEYKYCTLLDDECKKKIRTKYCPYKLNQKLLKYRQTLQKIKEIAETEINELTDSAINNGRYFEILDLIKESKGLRL